MTFPLNLLPSEDSHETHCMAKKCLSPIINTYKPQSFVYTIKNSVQISTLTFNHHLLLIRYKNQLNFKSKLSTLNLQ